MNPMPTDPAGVSESGPRGATARPEAGDPAAARGLAPDAALSLVRDELDHVEQVLRDGAGARSAAIAAIGRHLHQSGGKRIRAALVLLIGRLVDCPAPTRIRLAAIVEMIHAATLIHDDVIDDAPTRRGQPSANARWGNQRSVLAGDWLYMQSFRLALDERHFGVLDALISLTQAMVEGELLQLEMQGRAVSPAEHLDLIDRKTARLFSIGAQLPALAAARPPADLDRLARFGRHLGLAFQMVDDLLDFTATESALGKPVGGDLRQGKMTLPAIYAYEASPLADRRHFEQALAGEGHASLPWPELLALVASSGALARAHRESRDQASLALAAIEEFPPSPWRDALARLPELVIARGH
jgi:octaprenyl-diphosphate synthase